MVEVNLKFTFAGRARIAVSGSLRTQLSAQCQRCLKPMHLDIEHNIEVTVVDVDSIAASDKQIDLDGFDDAVEYQTKLDVHAFVEDELVLASPIIPQHERGMCAIPGEEDAAEVSPEASNEVRVAQTTDEQTDKTGEGQHPSSETTRPFAGLGDLMSANLATKIGSEDE